ncbi:hypothetical protein KQI63_06770 [bacterium]|nr:hypothetical protein [bacterium]
MRKRQMRAGRWFILLASLVAGIGIMLNQAHAWDDLPSNWARDMETADPERITLHQIGTSYGDRPIQLLQIGQSAQVKPAILVAANMDGNSIQSASAIMRFAAKLAADPHSTDRANWYLLLNGNPDGMEHFMDVPHAARNTNDRPVNDDMDDAVDEDGPDDLNKDMYISQMRQRHPEGEWLPVEGHPMLMRRADPANGERGIYRIFEEGIDNDGDGQLNEDPPGGVIIGRNFPHRFEHYVPEHGLFAASEPETRAILEFAFDHPEIAMVIAFGNSNTLRTLPMQDRDAGNPNATYELPNWFANRIGQDEGTKLPFDEILKLARQVFANPQLSEDRVMRWLSAGAKVNPDRRDKVWWEALIERYSAAMDSAGMPLENRLPSEDPAPGSFEEWAYYQYGVPSFALDFWTLPVPEEADSGSTEIPYPEDLSDELIALSHYPDTKVKPFSAWTAYDHPTLGPVEIGGKVKNVEQLLGDTDFEPTFDFITSLADDLPSLAIDSVAVTRTATDVYRVDAWVVNNGFLPYPTYQGRRTERPAPASLTLESNGTLLEGRSRRVLGLLEGSGGVEKMSWLVNGAEGRTITLTLASPSAGWETRTVTLLGGGQ